MQLVERGAWVRAAGEKNSSACGLVEIRYQNNRSSCVGFLASQIYLSDLPSFNLPISACVSHYVSGSEFLGLRSIRRTYRKHDQLRWGRCERFARVSKYSTEHEICRVGKAGNIPPHRHWRGKKIHSRFFVPIW